MTYAILKLFLQAIKIEKSIESATYEKAGNIHV